MLRYWQWSYFAFKFFMKSTFFVSVCIALAAHTQSGAQELSFPVPEKDTTTLRSFLKRGLLSGQARSYTSVTVNQKGLTDYAAWGIGAGLGYETPVFLGHFQAGMGGHFVFNVASSDLAQADPATGQPNRYEVGLFDVENPGKRRDINRLEELFLKTYFGKKSVLTVGRQIPQSPFINPQDGRMRPTLIEGAVVDFEEWKNLSLHGEYIWRISPRSTTRWYGVGESVGVYPVGIGVDGTPGQYKGNVQSGGIGILGATYQAGQWKVQLWDTYLENVLNTLLLKAEWSSEPIANKKWLLGGQYIYQHAVGEGGNPNPAKAYAQPGHQAAVLSGRLGWQSPRFDWFLNATRITADGRFLMPREWGREPFYTFLPRERNEGTGDVTAATLNTIFKPKKTLKLEASGGIFLLPDVREYTLNKYGQPAYTQVNLSATYQFGGDLKGLSGMLLLVRKDGLGETYENDRYVANKVNLTHINFILTYRY
jgi:hypothetical protein